MRSHRIRIFAPAIVATLLFTGACTATTTGGPARVSGRIPVVTCKTSRGVPESGPARYGSQLLPAATGLDVPLYDYYTDDARQIPPFLGPRGWSCHMLVAADGGVGITLAPARAAMRDMLSHVPFITANSEPACQGCVYGSICRLLPKVAKTFDDGQYAYERCSSRKPADERITESNGVTVVRYGRGTEHVLLYRKTKPIGGMASVASCTVVPSPGGLCPEILDDFIARDWGVS